MARLIKQINFPSDLRKFKKDQLKQISDELRDELIEVVSETGGHLGAGLGVVELTVALHYVFDTPKDKLVWDVSHQCYPHKIITGRRDRIKTLRKGGGLSGFTKDQKVNTILLVLHIAPLRFLQLLVWQLQKNYQIIIIMLLQLSEMAQ